MLHVSACQGHRVDGWRRVRLPLAVPPACRMGTMAAATHITAVTPITTAIIPRIRLSLGTIRTIGAAPAARGGKCDVHLCYGRARHAGRAGSPGGREVGPGLLRRCRERGAEALPFVYGATLGSQISSGWPSETGSPVKALTRAPWDLVLTFRASSKKNDTGTWRIWEIC